MASQFCSFPAFRINYIFNLPVGRQVLSTMNVKSDTKEKFHVITVTEPALSATMTDEMEECLLPYLQNDVKNLVLILKHTNSIDIAAAEKLVYHSTKILRE